MSNVANITANLEFSPIGCGECGVTFMMPKTLFDECQSRGMGKPFFCPNGHQRAFTESTEEKCRRDRDSLRRQLEEKKAEVFRVADQKDAEIKRLNRQIELSKKSRRKR